MPWRARDVRPLLLRRRASRPQLKRDPLGRGMSMRSFVSTLLLASTIACRPDGRRQTDSTTSTLRAGVTDSQTRLVPHVSTDSAQGTWIPPHFPGEGINVPATVSQDWMMTLQIGAQHIVFEKTPLDSHSFSGSASLALRDRAGGSFGSRRVRWTLARSELSTPSPCRPMRRLTTVALRSSLRTHLSCRGDLALV